MATNVELASHLRHAERTRQVIWAVCALAIVATLFLSSLLIRPGEPEATGAYLPAFHVAALSLAVFSIVLRSRLFSDQRLLAMLEELPPDAATAKPANFTGPLDMSSGLWQLYRRTLPLQIVGWTVNESIALLGLIAVWISNSAGALYPFLFMALVLHVLMFPRLEPLITRVRALQAAAENGQ